MWFSCTWTRIYSRFSIFTRFLLLWKIRKSVIISSIFTLDFFFISVAVSSLWVECLDNQINLFCDRYFLKREMFHKEKIQLNLLYNMSIFGNIRKNLFKQGLVSVMNEIYRQRYIYFLNYTSTFSSSVQVWLFQTRIDNILILR